MTKHTKIYLGLAVAVLVVGGVTIAVASDKLCVDPEAQMLRDLQRHGGENTPERREKLKGLGVLEKLEAAWCSRQNMSKEEVDRIVEEKKRSELEHQRELEELKKSGALEPRRLSPSELGIQQHAIDFIPPAKAYVQPTNTWLGYLGNTLFSVTGSAQAHNPMQGVIFIMATEHVYEGEIYPTPTATGPVKVVSEKNGVLTLQSIAGTYKIYRVEDGAVTGGVTTPGGATYTFDLATKTFR